MASNIVMDETYKNRPIRIYQGTAPTLRSAKCGDFEVLDRRQKNGCKNRGQKNTRTEG